MDLTKRTLFLLIFASIVGCGGAPQNDFPCAQAESHTDSSESDKKLEKEFLKKLNKIADAGKTATISKIRQQLSISKCKLKLPKASLTKMSMEQIYKRFKQSVVIIGIRYKCNSCSDWHLSTSSGFFITASGALITNYHVVDDSEVDSIAVMGADQKVHPVVKVLSADEDNDFVILQAQGKNFTPVSLDIYAPEGSNVCVISHPIGHFYTMTSGIVSRYYQKSEDKNSLRMAITAAYAKGSSGAPVFNERGNVVAIASYTRSVYYEKKRGIWRHLQMVFKHAVTTKSVLKAIEQ